MDVLLASQLCYEPAVNYNWRMENSNLFYVVMEFCMLMKLVMMFPTITFKPESVPKQLVSFGERSRKTISSVPC